METLNWALAPHKERLFLPQWKVCWRMFAAWEKTKE